MGSVDKSWMNLPRHDSRYDDGVNEFLNFAFSMAAVGNRIYCPCKKCKFGRLQLRKDVYDHLIYTGFMEGYTEWHFHGEKFSSEDKSDSIDDEMMEDDIDGLLHDTFGEVAEGRDGMSEGAKKFYELVEEGKQELYPGCKNFSKLSFTIRLYLLKCLHGMSNEAFTDLLTLLKEAFPHAIFPKSFNQAKKTIRNLGLECKKIHACPNDCMLYWKDHEQSKECHVCGASRYKQEGVKVPAKVLRHFPLKPRLQRLFMCKETAEKMVWHHAKRQKDGNLRHPADGEAWKDFDRLHCSFSQDPRNVRLGLASDGFNPLRTMSIAHSTWPVVLINYNLPPWMSIKPEYFVLSLLIPGPQPPGNDIDVYLQPLIEELKDLWHEGIQTYDAFAGQSFQMRAALLWTISDFPAFAMLSGWSTKGRLACPCCNHETCSKYLLHSRKFCYLGHRRFLPMNHPSRQDEKSFHDKKEERPPPIPLSGSEIMEELRGFNNKFGKMVKKKRGEDEIVWKKKSILFELPYWEHNMCRHNLDMMHIEKNICDNIIGTLLDIPGKTKDHVKARMDLLELGIMKDLQPAISDDDHRITYAKACFSMTSAEKDIFFKVLKDVKLPYGCASNISRCVQVRERKMSGYKSHDAHFILQYLLQVAVRKALPKRAAMCFIRLGHFFRAICSKVIKVEDLPHLQSEITEILCEFERIFPPAFFDIMVHLPIHLVEEVRLGGPVHYRWMFWVERYLGKLKSYVRNRSRPEGCIAEGYLAEECLTFCSRCMHEGMKTRLKNSSPSEKTSAVNADSSPFLTELGHPIGGKKRAKGKAIILEKGALNQAHRCVLFNTNNHEVEKYIKDHQDMVNGQAGRRNRWAKAQAHKQEFATWFKSKVKDDNAPNYLFWLASGPNPIVTRYKGYFINGYRFHTLARDSRCKTQNSGVTVTASTPSFASSKDQNPIDGDVTYYGVIKEILQLDYHSHFYVVLFKCDWFEIQKDERGLTSVNMNKLCCSNDPFVLASQVQQVFYVKDPVKDGLCYVLRKIPRDLFDLEDESDDEDQNSARDDSSDIVCDLGTLASEEFSHVRDDLPYTTIETTNDMVNGVSSAVEVEDDDILDDTDWDWMVSED